MANTLLQVQEFLPEIAKRSHQFERDRRVSDDVIAALKQRGCFRMFAPASFGGDEANLPDALRVIEALSCADGATGWTVSQVASSQLILAYFPKTTIAEIYAVGPDWLGAGAVAPKGQAVAHDQGWRVSGQWPFVTGCERASWIYLQCLVVEDRKLQMLPQGTPVVRMVLFPSTEVQIIDTWHVVGLRGTASHDISVSGVLCPNDRSANLVGSKPTLEGPVYRIPLLDQGGLLIAAVALGIARGAIEELASLAAGGKHSSFARERLSQSAVFQDQLGAAYMELEGARALLYLQAGNAWDAAVRASPQTLLERASLRATPSAAIAAAMRVVDTAYALAGGTAVYNSSPLQRMLRDIHAAKQHVYAGRHSLGVLGALVAREEIDKALF